MVELVVRVVLSLGVVLGLFWMVARTGSRKLGGRDRALVTVRSRQSLSRGSSLAVVEVGSRVLVVGVSDGGVRLLTELDPGELAETRPAPRPASRRVRAAQPAAAAEPTGHPDPAGYPDYSDVYSSRFTHEPADVPDDAYGPDYAAAYAPAAYDVAVPTGELAPRSSRAHGDADGPLAGSLLDTGVWRGAWASATGRARRDGDAA